MTKNVFGIGLLLLLIVLHVLSSGILKLSGPANAFIYFTDKKRRQHIANILKKYSAGLLNRWSRRNIARSRVF